MFRIEPVSAATAVQPINKEEVRLAVIELGYNGASQRLGIKPGTLRQWARRFRWNVTRSHAQETVTTVTLPSVAVESELAENERETRLSLSRYARRSAKNAESATLRDSPYVHKAAQVAGLAFKWGSDDKPSHFTLNMLNINSLQLPED